MSRLKIQYHTASDRSASSHAGPATVFIRSMDSWGSTPTQRRSRGTFAHHPRGSTTGGRHWPSQRWPGRLPGRGASLPGAAGESGHAWQGWPWGSWVVEDARGAGTRAWAVARQGGSDRSRASASAGQEGHGTPSEARRAPFPRHDQAGAPGAVTRSAGTAGSVRGLKRLKRQHGVENRKIASLWRLQKRAQCRYTGRTIQDGITPRGKQIGAQRGRQVTNRLMLQSMVRLEWVMTHVISVLP